MARRRRKRKSVSSGKACRYGKVKRGRRKGQCLKSKRRPKTRR